MRRETISFMIRNVGMGSDYPVTVQSMTNTDSHDVDATLAQVNQLAELGAALVRVAAPDMDAVPALAAVAKQSPVPIIADVHFDYKIAIACLEQRRYVMRDVFPQGIEGVS